MAKSSGEQADQAGKSAEKTGLQVEAYGKLAFALAAGVVLAMTWPF